MTLIVAANIEAHMSARGITAAELARNAKINATGVYDILSGKSRSPRLETLEKLSAALRVPLVQLLSQPSDAAKKEQIAQVFEQLPEGEQKRLLLTAQAWLDAQPGA